MRIFLYGIPAAYVYQYRTVDRIGIGSMKIAPANGWVCKIEAVEALPFFYRLVLIIICRIKSGVKRDNIYIPVAIHITDGRESIQLGEYIYAVIALVSIIKLVPGNFFKFKPGSRRA